MDAITRRKAMTPIRRTARLGGLLVAALFVASLAAGCSSGSGSIKVTEPWARASSAMAAAGAAYMKIENTGSAVDALIGAASPAARTVEVHETVAMESAVPSDGMGMESPMPSASGDMGGGMMGMQPIARLEIPAGGTVELKPGSYHIMLIDLNRELKAGDTIEISLTFEKAGTVKVTAEVRES
jgi:periplasmic copper chaperone A